MVVTSIVTKKGDDGTSSILAKKERLLKNDAYFNAIGTIDELNCFISFAISRMPCEFNYLQGILKEIQHELFTVGYIINSNDDEASKNIVNKIDKYIKNIENRYSLPEITGFVIPGGNEISSTLHVCRAICRRAERAIIDINTFHPWQKESIKYLNRLSDLLFIMAVVSAKENLVKWKGIK